MTIKPLHIDIPVRLNELQIAFSIADLAEYSRHMELHRIKTNPGILQTIIVNSAEAAENVVKLNLSKLANNTFFLHRRRVELMEAEANAPGKEVAYIYKARQIL